MKQPARKRPSDPRPSARNDPKQRHAPKTPTPWHVRHRDWLLAVALFLVVLFAYQPAWHGAMIWDDDCHMTKPALRSWQGLGRIWVDLRATQQYYPLLHSAFWLEWQLWGDDTFGYHLVNILLHSTSAILVAAILRRLAVPGAYLAAAIFALHPVHVESVAWITELKNTLSGVFYLSAFLVYLRFDETRRRSFYFGAMTLFLLGLLSKTVIATLPAALLVVFWWKRGRLQFRRDVLPLLPLFALGAAAGLFTAWVEHTVGGAQGERYSLTLIERCLIAGRAVWFYFAKLVWPANLTFIYPRWHVSQAEAWQYAFPVAAFFAILGLWAVRRRTRGPLAAILFFVGTLFPVLGFFNVYPFRYSFVADHFQYLASLGAITLAAAAIATLLARFRLWGQSQAYLVCGLLLFALATRTWMQCWMYVDLQLLYETTIDRNPDCLMAYKNLNALFLERGESDKSLVCCQNVVRIDPKDDEGYLNLGTAYKRLGQLDLALKAYRTALDINPNSGHAHFFIANALFAKQQFPEAIAAYREAIARLPDSPEAHSNFASALLAADQPANAAAEYRKAIELNPNYAPAHFNLARALFGLHQYDEAITHCRKALDLQPNLPNARELLDALHAQLDQIKAKTPDQKKKPGQIKDRHPPK